MALPMLTALLVISFLTPGQGWIIPGVLPRYHTGIFTASGDDESSGSASQTTRKRRRTTPRSRPQRRRPREDTPNTQHPFDPVLLTSKQTPNRDAEPFDLASMSTAQGDLLPPDHAYMEYFSLDDLFPGLDFSQKFASNRKFREGIRTAMREDIFHSTPIYAKLSPKAVAMMLSDDSSVQGAWRCDVKEPRMSSLTKILADSLGERAPSGDELMNRIGALCGTTPSHHWIDIVGVKDRFIKQSWHQDTGLPLGDTFTVLWGFPAENDYIGTGVYSHMVKLTNQNLALLEHPRMEPILFPGIKAVEDPFVVRPLYEKGKEILRFRDTDSIHSAPDVTYRSSVMRFM